MVNNNFDRYRPRTSLREQTGSIPDTVSWLLTNSRRARTHSAVHRAIGVAHVRAERGDCGVRVGAKIVGVSVHGWGEIGIPVIEVQRGATDGSK